MQENACYSPEMKMTFTRELDDNSIGTLEGSPRRDWIRRRRTPEANSGELVWWASGGISHFGLLSETVSS